jgi:hypothetical protein
MSKIQVDKIELKNFFSYGNAWQTIDLHEGVNIVLGHDVDKERSNGAGKCVRGNTEVCIEFDDPETERLFLESIE